MKLLQVLSLVLGLCLGANAANPAGPATTGTGIDSLGRFQVNATVPAGTRYAVLEITDDLTSAAPWRKMLACEIDGLRSTSVWSFPTWPTAPALSPPPARTIRTWPRR